MSLLHKYRVKIELAPNGRPLAGHFDYFWTLKGAMEQFSGYDKMALRGVRVTLDHPVRGVLATSHRSFPVKVS